MSRRDIAADARSLPLFAWSGAYTNAFRSDGRMHDTGRIKPSRPCPHDFRETYVRLGWGEIMEHYRANWRCISRWIDECGRAELKRERSEYVQRHGRQSLHVDTVDQCKADRQSRRRRYVLGQTLTPKVK